MPVEGVVVLGVGVREPRPVSLSLSMLSAARSAFSVGSLIEGVFFVSGITLASLPPRDAIQNALLSGLLIMIVRVEIKPEGAVFQY